jgi:hypothetical protein
MELKAPFPYFGGKSAVASIIWQRFGDVPNYVEPFFGSGAVLLGRPHPSRCETVNDADGLVSNFWRAVQHEPEAVARHADWPVNENDLHARHAWLVGQKDNLQSRLEGDPEFHDAKIAGWWCWGMCCWIGSGFCSGNGPWQVVDRQLVHLGDKGRGVNRQLVHLGDKGQGVNRKRVIVTNDGVGCTARRLSTEAITAWMQRLADRLRHTRVCCGDWSRVCGPSPTVKQGLTGVFLDPPYAAEAGRASELYRNDCPVVAHNARDWCLSHADEPLLRIALCGYEGEHDMPNDWECIPWKARGGFASQRKDGVNDNATKERLWFSPHCLKVGGAKQEVLFT